MLPLKSPLKEASMYPPGPMAAIIGAEYKKITEITD